VHFNDALFEGDSEFLVEILNLFLETCPALLSAVEDAISRNDAQAIRRAAHTLKGSVSNFGAPKVVECALELEMIGLDGNLARVGFVWRALQDLVAELLLEMRAKLDDMQ
jgi:HPt (histidine-containing phosphotransfer) domain-containing protein